MKRVWSVDGKSSAPAWFVRTMLVLAVPLMLPWAFVSTLGREWWHGLRFAWLEARIELDAAKRVWQSAVADPSKASGEDAQKSPHRAF